MNEILPFYTWKEQQIQLDSKEHGVVRYLRLKEWYWKEYGKYCNKIRNNKDGVQT